MTERWVRALPLLLSSSVLLIAAAYAFFQGKNGTASIASFAAGLILLGAWATTAVVDWYEGHEQRALLGDDSTSKPPITYQSSEESEDNAGA
jgi:hypothetical protein